MKLKLSSHILTIVLLLFINLIQGQTTFSGKILDQETNEPLPGVNIVIQGTSEGIVTDFNGDFEFRTNTQLPFTVEVSSLGFGTKTIQVTTNNQSISLSLEVSGENLDEIVISASRRPQKVQEAPSSVSIITAKDIKNSADPVEPVRQLINIPGVHLQQQTANTINIEMRAGSAAFGTSTFPILDYRYLVTPSAGTFLSYQSGLSNIDIAKIEVVRGAGSALYGPGVTSGVVHFISKNPIDYPGTTLELLAGTLKTFGINFRHAYSNKSKTLGFKVNARITRGDDFELDPVADAEFIKTLRTNIYNPQISNNRVNAAQQGTLLLSLSDLDDNKDGNPIATKYRNYSFNTHLELRPNEETSAFLSMGVANGGGLFFNSQGVGYTQGNDYWSQFRIQSGGLFGQVYYNNNDGGDAANPTFLYASGFRQIAKRESVEAQLQYNFDIPGFLDTNVTAGVDYRYSTSDSQNSLYGVNDANDDYIITGLYLQGTSKLGEKLDLTYAGRYDKFNFIDNGAFAPRVALVYKVSPKHTIRASYNIATFGPTALEQNVDFPVSVIAPGVVDVWLSGQSKPQNFSPNPVIDVSIPGVPDLPTNTPGLPLAVPYGAVAAETLAALIPGLLADGQAASFVPVIQNFFSTYVPSGFTGQLSPYNLFNNERLDQLVGTGTSEIGRVSSYEIGYTGLIGDRLKVALDVYTYERKGFTEFTAIGPTYRLSNANVIGDLPSTVTKDILPVLRDAITAEVTQGVTNQYTSNNIPTAGIPSAGVPSLQDAIANTLATNLPAADGLATLIGNSFIPGATVFDNNAKQLYPVFGAVETTLVPQGDNITHISAGYRRFGNATRSHFGADLALEYFVNDEFSVWGNTSWLSQNVWIPGQSDDDGLPFSSYLNAPKFKYRLGLKYLKEGGLRFGTTFQHDDSFQSNQGVFSGTVQERNLVDANLGYDFGDGIELDISATNLFDQKYRTYPNLPVIGRRVIVKGTINF